MKSTRKVTISAVRRKNFKNNTIAAFVRAMHLGASVGEDWVVMNAAANVWNNYTDAFTALEYANVTSDSASVAELCKVESCDKVLLGNFADALSCGYMSMPRFFLSRMLMIPKRMVCLVTILLA